MIMHIAIIGIEIIEYIRGTFIQALIQKYTCHINIDIR